MSKEYQDPFLVSIIQAINNSDGEFPITLNVDGSVVTGTLISTVQYFKELGNLISQSAENTQKAEVWLRMVNDMADHFKATLAESSADKPVDYTFIHLKDASCIVGNSGFDKQQCLWRGQIDRVDGFMPGAYVLNRDN